MQQIRVAQPTDTGILGKEQADFHEFSGKSPASICLSNRLLFLRIAASGLDSMVRASLSFKTTRGMW